ncbi:MAG: HAMP domain-containing protein [Candidatus Bipolaricaulota bacterium]
MTTEHRGDGRRTAAKCPGEPHAVGPVAHLRSRVRYGISLRGKLVVPTLGLGLLVVAALFAFAYLALISSVESIYEARARSVAAVVSKSIQDKDYVLYYSEKLNEDIQRLLEQYDSIVGIAVIGASARGFVTVASTDPTQVGIPASNLQTERLESLREGEVSRTRIGATPVLQAVHPIESNGQRVGAVVVDMSLDEQSTLVRRLSWQFAAAAVGGFALLGGLLYLILTWAVTRPVRRLADAANAVAGRTYDVDLAPQTARLPGTPLRDEVGQLVDNFHLMAKVMHAHEGELRRLVLLDEVTGAYNAEHFRSQLPVELSKGSRYGHPTSLLVIDLEGVERLSEAERRKVRIATAAYLVKSLRKVDSLFALSDDRFVALLPETPPAGAAVAAARLLAYSSDVAASTEYSVAWTASPMGWEAGAGPVAEDLVARLLRKEARSE